MAPPQLAFAQEFSKQADAIKPVPVADGAAPISPANTQIEFIGLHVGDDPKPRLGGFAKYSGELGVADGKLTSVAVKIDTASIWTEFDKLTQHLNAADFFNTAEHPAAAFESTKITPGKKPGTVDISGELTFMGETKPFTFPATVSVSEKGITLVGSFDFNRIAHGITGHENGVEKLVKISVVVGQPSTHGADAAGGKTAGDDTGNGRAASGLAVGEEVEPWEPVHVSGPHKGTQACPVCTYMKAPAVVAFCRSGPETQAMIQQLEQLLADRQGGKLHAFVVLLDTPPVVASTMADAARLRLTSVCCLDPKTRAKDLEKYKINPAAENTVMVYKDYKVVANYNNLNVSEDPDTLEQAVDGALN
ncbi:YceI family protein [Posidoniimonas polymericola]|uniref:YceI family protein n=1 Tax=Posidoniimonas polymericola TaxID=2528002 RepID=UPI0018D33967|nr:YceI family protein [Posidoniimonas polymericola]